MKNVKLLWQYMKGNRLIYIGSILSIGISTLINVINPLIIRTTIDSIIGDAPVENTGTMFGLIQRLGGVEKLRDNIWMMAILLVALTVINGVFLYLKGKLASTAAESTAKKIKDQLYDHLQHLHYEYHVKAETGDLIQRCTSDVENIRRFLGVQFVEIGSALFILGFVLVIMLNLHLKMTLISMIAVPIIFTFAIIFFKKIKDAFQQYDESEAKMSTVLQENLTGVRVVRAFARQDYEIQKFEEKNSVHRRLTNRIIRLLALYWSSSDLICFLQIALVLIVGAYWTANGTITLGTLVVFTTYEGMLLWPIRQLGRIIGDMGKTLVAVERIQEILDEQREQMVENNERPMIRGNIQFDNVYFEYEKNKPIFDNISFEVKEGQTVAILGPTGAGKSTLAYLMARLYDYQGGSIKVDGHELKDMDKVWVRKNVGVVLQEPFLFAKSIRDNIKLAKPRSSDDEVFQVAKVASIHDTILEFDQGYETMVGERGVSLSGGQKQRVAIARTLIGNSPIVIFDDSLSAVDTETDNEIRNALKSRKNKATTFIISHRITTLSEADFIIVLEKGKITEIGNHTELMNNNGLYRRVWEIQNSIEGQEEIVADKRI
ncbi:ABC transporter ATP-binding protein [Alkaliphilus oremlandii]|uniref:ABC transporter related n=1 Tax=Alkaliphilus oremlandii (strain OhILAs) TaxID=350688 RepID=A8MI52_ALKOO|nr:ABC transporter ATP-binding protein [Alkaliphilus oremlandii]ABW19484.1 ABC transporter related [Alkaliphilus oremlandii OhILAs]